MSTGRIVVCLPGVSADGIFLNGYIVSGEMKIQDIIYKGTYDSNNKIDGVGSTYFCKTNTEYVGNYNHGKFINGSKYKMGVLVEHGKYNSYASHKEPCMTNGEKRDEHCSRNGLFDKSGRLVNGCKIYYNENKDSSENNDIVVKYTGVFDSSEQLIDGIIEYPCNNFKACVVLTYEPSESSYILNQCIIEYNGDAEYLSDVQLCLFACQGKSARFAHLFYLYNLSKYTIYDLKRLSDRSFLGLNADSLIGLEQIMGNMQKVNGNILQINSIDFTSASIKKDIRIINNREDNLFKYRYNSHN